MGLTAWWRDVMAVEAVGTGALQGNDSAPVVNRGLGKVL
jgi:hypothetical protein